MQSKDNLFIINILVKGESYMLNLPNNKWGQLLFEETQKDYYKKLDSFLENEYAETTIFPSKNDIFNSLVYTDADEVKVVILGQDPYHEINQAHGLSFSVMPNVTVPPSLVNIYKELKDDLNCYIPNNGYLVKWAKQGVLLLNTVLTTRNHIANAHKGKGWEKFTDRIIAEINKLDKPVVFMLWGKSAQDKCKYLNNPKHLVLKSVHPSPLSVYRGFFGCKHFSQANEFLINNGSSAIDWQIENI